MFNKNKFVAVAMVAVVAGTLAGPSRAALVDGPKVLRSAADVLAMPAWGAMAYDFKCIENLDDCQGVPKKVALFSAPKALKPEVERLQLNARVLPPIGHSLFCLQYPKDCQVQKIAFRGGKVALTPERMRDLAEVNAKVNHGIKPEPNLLGIAAERWIISPKAGDCNDYAVTKQHELRERGWPSRALLLAEVATNWGEHHLILVVRTAQGDLVLDNLTGNIRPWAGAPYQWVKVQSPRNPTWWTNVRTSEA